MRLHWGGRHYVARSYTRFFYKRCRHYVAKTLKSMTLPYSALTPTLMPPAPYLVDFPTFSLIYETHDFAGLRNIAALYTAKRYNHAPTFPFSLLFYDPITPFFPKKGRTKG